jgi:tryptophanyl-tRNA synthetase
MGELRRMTQFKDKGGAQESVRVGLFTYPVLMAADILLYDADRVPVGDDQRQHLELARELANRFNFRYGDTFVVPEGSIPLVGARVMDLQHPERKMSKSTASPLGTIAIMDSPQEITKKIKKAVTDTDGEVRFDRENKPGLANLLELLAAATDSTPTAIAANYTRYGDLKNDVAEALISLLEPLQRRYEELARDKGAVEALMAKGAQRAGEIASATYTRAAQAIGLLAP